jgi:predicted ATPase/DNA-binding CsgD family transcriptional regulator
MVTGRSAPSSRLPRSPTALVGRADDVATVCSWFLDQGARLVTLIGPGGIGKTALALEIADGLVDTFAGDVTFVPLAAVAEPSQVVPAIADALAVRETAEIGPLDHLVTELRDRTALLVLDNVERLTAAGADLGQLLAACARLCILATSRSPLQIRSERLFPVGALPVPGLDVPSTLEAVLSYPAVALFVERARAATPDFVLNAADAGVAAEICRRLEGIPLAIELAAAWMKILTPPALLARLERRLPLLADGPRDLPTRLQTMRAAIAWSYDGLTPARQTLFRRLSVFVGGCPLRAAETLLDRPPAEMLADLAALVDQSLLRPAEQDDEPRFAMLETIREFGLEQLAAIGEGSDARARHAAFYLAFAETARPRLQGGDRASWLPSLEREHDNLRVALAWFVERGDGERALRLTGALWRFWWWRSHLREGHQHLTAVLALSSGVSSETSARAEALTGCAALTEALGDYAGSDALYEEALALWRRLGDAQGLAVSLAFRWLVAFDLEDFARMTALATEALTLSRQLADDWGIAMASMELGLIAMRQRDRTRAETHLREGLTLFAELKDDWGAALCLGGLGNVALDAHDLQSAADQLAKSLDLFLRWGDTWGLATVLPAAARLAAEAEDADRAVRLYGAASALHDAIGAPLKAPFRKLYEETLARCRGTLGEEAFAAASAGGRDLKPAEAVALAQSLPLATKPRRVGPSPVLTPRELEVLRLDAQGYTAREIGEALFIAESTVLTHREHIRNKLGLSKLKELTAYAQRHGLI